MTVIFDLDGTLVNSLYDLGDSVNGALSDYSLPQHSYDEYRGFVGNGTRVLVRRSVPEEVRGTELEENVFNDFSKRYEQNCLNKTKPYKGIREALCRLKNSGALLSVASNKPEEFCRKIVKSLFDEGLFDVIAGSREAAAGVRNVRKKPCPDVIFEILSLLPATSGKCVMVGDSDVDVATAKNAGIGSIGCSWGYRSRQTLIKAGCDIVIDSPMELETAVNRVLLGDEEAWSITLKR